VCNVFVFIELPSCEEGEESIIVQSVLMHCLVWPSCLTSCLSIYTKKARNNDADAQVTRDVLTLPSGCCDYLKRTNDTLSMRAVCVYL